MSDTLVMDRRIVWDSKNKKEVEEAKKIILDFKRKGHTILRASGETMEFFRPYFEEVIVKAEKVHKNIMRVLCESGDDRIVWDKEDGYEAKEAKAKFSELVKKGYKAYSVDSKGQKNRRIKEFDVDAEEILMVPPTAAG